MKLLNVLKTIICESRDTYYGSFFYNNIEFKVYGSSHAHEASSGSGYSGRYDVGELYQTIMDFDDVYGKLAMDIISDKTKNSIVTFDNLLNVNFLTYVNYVSKDVVILRIHTSLKNRRTLNVTPENKVLIITKSGNTVIKEQFENDNFTKIVRGDIIIYIS
jgi:hypothetical protein